MIWSSVVPLASPSLCHHCHFLPGVCLCLVQLSGRPDGPRWLWHCEVGQSLLVFHLFTVALSAPAKSGPQGELRSTGWSQSEAAGQNLCVCWTYSCKRLLTDFSAFSASPSEAGSCPCALWCWLPCASVSLWSGGSTGMKTGTFGENITVGTKRHQQPFLMLLWSPW